MIWFRSLLFNIFFFSWVTILLLFSWLFLPFPRMAMQRMLRIWSRIATTGMYVLGGISFRVEGAENIPDGAALIASKHQSIWDTFIMYVILDDPQYVLKQELMQIPFWGWYAAKSQHIPIDRNAGAKALKDMVRHCVDRIKKGRQVIIFPEGTRTAPGEVRQYHPGVAAIYKQLPDGVPVVPVALNSGTYWGRRKFNVKPGTIRIVFLPQIQTGLDRKTFMATLEERIETSMGPLTDGS